MLLHFELAWLVSCKSSLTRCLSKLRSWTSQWEAALQDPPTSLLSTESIGSAPEAGKPQLSLLLVDCRRHSKPAMPVSWKRLGSWFSRHFIKKKLIQMIIESNSKGSKIDRNDGTDTIKSEEEEKGRVPLDDDSRADLIAMDLSQLKPKRKYVRKNNAKSPYGGIPDIYEKIEKPMKKIEKVATNTFNSAKLCALGWSSPPRFMGTIAKKENNLSRIRGSARTSSGTQARRWCWSEKGPYRRRSITFFVFLYISPVET